MDLALPLYHTILRAAAHCTTPRSNARRSTFRTWRRSG